MLILAVLQALLLRSSMMCLRGHRSSNHSPLTSKLIWPTPRVTWSLVALFDCWYFQLSSTLTPTTGSGGKGSPSSREKIFFNIEVDVFVSLMLQILLGCIIALAMV